MMGDTSNVSEGHTDHKAEIRDVIGLTLICDDMTSEKVERRTFTFHKKNIRTIDLVRATVGKQSRLSQTETSARATFSSPVMSRRHARVQFHDDETLSVTDMGSLHGTLVQSPATKGSAIKLKPSEPHVLASGDIITLGKDVYRENKLWTPVIVKVSFIYGETRTVPTELAPPAKEKHPEVIEILDDDEPEEQDTPNRFGVYSSSSSSYQSEDDEDDDDSERSASFESDNKSMHSSPSHTSLSSKFYDRLPFMPFPPFGAPSRLPSLRDLGIFSSVGRAGNGRITSNQVADESLNSASVAALNQTGVSLMEGFSSTSAGNQICLYMDQCDGPSDEIEEFSNVNNTSRYSSPMQISSGIPSRSPSVQPGPSIIGAYPDSVNSEDKQPFENITVLESAPSPLVRLPSRPWEESNSTPLIPFPNILTRIRDVQESSALLVPAESIQDEPLEGQSNSNPSEKLSKDRPAVTPNWCDLSFTSLSTKLQDLVQSEMTGVMDRIQDLKESIVPLVERQVAVAKAMATAGRTALVSPTPERGTGQQPISPQQELQDIREQMLRFSAMMEQILERVEPMKAGHDEQAVQTAVSPAISETGPFQPRSNKRKRDVDEVDEMMEVVLPNRPSKRSKPSGSIVRSVATAAGYTSLGAIATWATFAYYL